MLPHSPVVWLEEQETESRADWVGGGGPKLTLGRSVFRKDRITSTDLLMKVNFYLEGTCANEEPWNFFSLASYKSAFGERPPNPQEKVGKLRQRARMSLALQGHTAGDWKARV